MPDLARTDEAAKGSLASGALASGGAWSNWSGNVQSAPRQFAAPRDAAEAQAILAGTKGEVRVRGAGHSFTPLCASDGVQMTLEDIAGDVVGVDLSGDEPVARMQAGASLNSLSRALQARGLAFKNLGDIDVQSLAGATMTGTHGTGEAFPCLSGEIQAIKLMTASGEVIEAGPDGNPELVDAARVSVGALGVLLEADVRVRPAFKLHRKTRLPLLKDIMANAETTWATNRNFEFFSLSNCDYGAELTHNETTAPDIGAEADDDEAIADHRRLRDWLGWFPWLRRKVTNAIVSRMDEENMVGDSWRLLANQRNVIFNEMEYHLPVDQGLEALDEALYLIRRERPEVFWPIETRKTAADGGWISPFHGAPRISIAVHAGQGDDHSWFITRLEPIFRRRGGRPHWGKIHSLTRRDCLELYPEFERFAALRRELDPAGRFLNAHLRGLFEGRA